MSTTPNPDEVTAELALNRALRWIDRPRDASAWLWIGGRAGCGRTALLREVVARHPGAVHVDCAGKSAEEVARELATALGIPAPDSFKDNFGTVARRISDDPVVVLANTQWAGRLRTSREPERVLDRVARALITFHPRGLRMRLLVEVDDAPGRADELRGRHLTLQGGFESMPPFAEPDDDAALPSALDALALAEHRFVPLPVWSLLCSALGRDFPESRLESLLGDPAARDWIHRTDDGTGTPLVSFTQEAMARHLRTRMPAEEARSWHARAVTALSAADAPEATRWYAARALAGHAAAADQFEAFLNHTAAVAGVSHETLFEGFEAAFHARPIPQGSAGARLHYMARRGVQPSSQGEWLALLHLTLMQAGPTQEAAADRLLAAAGPVTLPWRTLWAEGVGAGEFNTDTVVSRPIVETPRIVHTSTGSLVTLRTRREHIGTWDLVTGTPRTEPDETAETSDTTHADQGPKGWRPGGAASGEVDLPRMPEYIRRGTRSGRHIALATTDGVCVVEINQNAGHENAPGLLKRLVATDTQLARADLPAQTLAPTTDWLTDIFGSAAVKRFPQETLPDTLTDSNARAFLSDVGFPCVTGLLELDTTSLEHTGLHPVTEPFGKPDETESTYFSLGTWQRARLLLDGRDGRVLQDGWSGIEDELAGSSLGQFVAMVRLYYWWRASDWSIEDTESDLRHWLNLVDPQAFQTQSWQRVFEDYNFDDRV
ncbi:SUKH-4 family immunity protein [Streptomyces ferrugineus]|uniref:SUKH-4 family immunity protein n=1 Tax=Streptomyces ferrugineus TaxID=1413221 RepID=A0A7M2SFS2_9ACTN|nr:SUKH-4 family immunity protein [Streptomyces ferrugineus]QOV35154.1 SUKH-4 family immunity protein [Streptomyces ferrugineus]